MGILKSRLFKPYTNGAERGFAAYCNRDPRLSWNLDIGNVYDDEGKNEEAPEIEQCPFYPPLLVPPFQGQSLQHLPCCLTFVLYPLGSPFCLLSQSALVHQCIPFINFLRELFLVVGCYVPAPLLTWVHQVRSQGPSQNVISIIKNKKSWTKRLPYTLPQWNINSRELNPKYVIKTMINFTKVLKPKSSKFVVNQNLILQETL